MRGEVQCCADSLRARSDFLNLRLKLIDAPAEGAESIEHADFPPLYFEVSDTAGGVCRAALNFLHRVEVSFTTTTTTRACVAV